MLLVYLLVFLSPVALILLVMFAIGLAVARTARTGKRMFYDFKPYLDDLKQQANGAQQRVLEFSQRGNNLGKSFEEIAGRWAFIGQTFQEATSSPVVRIAEMAGKYTVGRKKD